MITGAKNYTKKKKDRSLGQMVKQSYTDKVIQRSIHIHTQKKRKRKLYIYIYI